MQDNLLQGEANQMWKTKNKIKITIKANEFKEKIKNSN